MWKTLIVSLILTLSCFVFPAYGQVYLQNTLYTLTPQLYNPAAIGLDDSYKFTFMGRLQWAGFDGAPTTFYANVNRGFEGVGSGFSLSLMQDALGPFNINGIRAGYAFILNFDGDPQPQGLGPQLRIGIDGGFEQRSLNAQFITRMNEPIVSDPNYAASTLLPQLGAGLFFSNVVVNDADKSKVTKYYLGISGQNLLEPSIEDLVFSSIGPESNVARTLNLMGAYRFNVGQAAYQNNNDTYVQPGFMIQTDGAVYQYNLSTEFVYRSLHAGLNYRGTFVDDSESIAAFFGFDIDSDLFLGYAYDYTLNTGFAGSHELVVTYYIRTAGKASGQEGDVIDKGGRGKPVP